MDYVSDYSKNSKNSENRESFLSIFTPFNIFTVVSIVVLFSIVIYIFNKDWTGPRGMPGPNTDLSDYKGDVSISGNIKATGSVNSGDCRLTCNSPEKDSGMGASTIALIVLILLLIGGGIYYKRDYIRSMLV